MSVYLLEYFVELQRWKANNELHGGFGVTACRDNTNYNRVRRLDRLDEFLTWTNCWWRKPSIKSATSLEGGDDLNPFFSFFFFLLGRHVTLRCLSDEPYFRRKNCRIITATDNRSIVGEFVSRYVVTKLVEPFLLLFIWGKKNRIFSAKFGWPAIGLGATRAILIIHSV